MQGDTIRTGVSEIIYNQSVKRVLDSIYGIKDKIDAEKANYGKILATMGIGQPTNPFPSGGNWQDLTQAWLKRKGTTVGNQQFYRGLTGGLEADLEESSTEGMLGETQVLVKDWVWEANGFYNPRIRKTIDVVYRNERGQFASKSQYNKKPVQVRVIPFPDLSNSNNPAQDIIKSIGISTLSMEKLGKNNSLRPLIIPFTQYFFQTRIYNIVASYIGNLK